MDQLSRYRTGSASRKGNGQDILAGFADFLGAQFRYMGGLFQAQGQ